MMRKIRVAHIITRLNTGGAQEVALSLASLADKDRFESVFVSGPEGFSKEMADGWNVNVTIIPGLIREINPVKDLAALIRLYLFIKKNNFDIVHAHTSKAGFIGRMAARLAGVPVIFYTPHGSVFQMTCCGPITKFILSRIENFAASFTDKIIACSKDEKDDFLKHGVAREDKYTIIYWGVRQERFLKDHDKVLKRKEFNIPQDAILIANIGRLVPQKGHAFCLEAFKILIHTFPAARLLVAGDGELRQEIESNINKMGLGDNVIMAGERKDVPEILSASDIFLHTSLWEGMPIVIIEAMLAGKPIVATRVGGVPELIEDGISGLLVPPRDSQALAAAVRRLINDRFFAENIGRVAQQSAREKFSLDLMIKNTEGLYNRFIISKNIRGKENA